MAKELGCPNYTNKMYVDVLNKGSRKTKRTAKEKWSFPKDLLYCHPMQTPALQKMKAIMLTQST